MIRTIFVKESLLIMKDKGVVFWLFLLPILFIVIFSSIFGGTGNTVYKIDYYDADNTAQSRQFIQTLEQMKGLQLQQDRNQSLDKQMRGIREGKQTSLLVIPEGYGERLNSGETASVELYRDAAQDAAVAPVAAILESAANQYREQKLRTAILEFEQGEAAETLLSPPVRVREIKENAAKANTVTQIVPGYTVMFVFFIMISMIHTFLRDRDSGMLSRLQGTPMKPHHYLIGMWLPHILVVFIQSTVLLAFGKLVYGLHLGDLFPIALIVIGLAVCSTGLGLMLSMLVSSGNMGIALVQIIAMGGAIVGGLWFPYDMLPKAVQMIGKFTPQYWAQRGMQDVMIRGGHIGDVWLTILILFVCGLIGLAIATSRFKHFSSKAIH